MKLLYIVLFLFYINIAHSQPMDSVSWKNWLYEDSVSTVWSEKISKKYPPFSDSFEKGLQIIGDSLAKDFIKVHLRFWDHLTHDTNGTYFHIPKYIKDQLKGTKNKIIRTDTTFDSYIP